MRCCKIASQIRSAPSESEHNIRCSQNLMPKSLRVQWAVPKDQKEYSASMDPLELVISRTDRDCREHTRSSRQRFFGRV